MELPKELTTVTLFSKILAMILFITLPIISFVLGMNYQKNITMEDYQSISRMAACTEEAKICPDGSSVGRIGPDCSFAPCPSTSKKPNLNENQDYECPKNKSINCMPGPGLIKSQCNASYINWVKINCEGVRIVY